MHNILWVYIDTYDTEVYYHYISTHKDKTMNNLSDVSCISSGAQKNFFHIDHTDAAILICKLFVYIYITIMYL